MEKGIILGAGESGVGTAILARQKGVDVMVSDFGYIAEQYKTELDAYGISWEEGGHSDSLLDNASWVVKSPGIPRTAPIIQRVEALGIPILSEIEYAGRFYQGKSICITGSNGKTTTTSLIYHILSKAGLNVGVGGNIGMSFARQVAQKEFDWFVLELSSFQLEDMIDFKADISILLNITPDHLDRYEYQIEKYADAKFRVIQNQKSEDLFIYFEEDSMITKRSADFTSITSVPFSLSQSYKKQGVSILNGVLHAELDQHVFEIDTKALPLKGAHNGCNMMAATLASLRVGLSNEEIAQGLESFQAVEHRLELCRELEGVRYINDSKATNVDATKFALDAFDQDIIWIVGGTDKGNDYSVLEKMVQEKVKAIICLGVDNHKIIEAFEKCGIPMVETNTMQSAVEAAYSHTTTDSIVLLSPCCASFDLFKSYIDRGNQFKNCVKQL
ncbi:UDP-N-acetylmuramoyl-L-alanine--D-glutamate ligase [Halosquirtibacter laminarini]|uniref:UDP-N-acetylmuramoyl-L-alanine--D-glutamate ligase n=1 Tax=Halosquirtibacter laminarini TaxID=3374600 RepID=A0AC61NCZ6_9BACT|nr:UDP-N-acetylmuramoyl-L-alanine--D-glutamate ligase [Prolixibacteraceae bacterium]